MENSDMKQIRRRGIILLLTVFLLGFVFVCVQLYKIQITDGHIYKSKVSAQSGSSVMINPTRGSIYDRNNKVLAQSIIVWNVCISPAEIEEEQWDVVARELSRVLEIEETEILKFKEKTESYYELIKTGVDNGVREEINAFLSKYSDLKIRGVFTRETYKRHYTYDNLAANLIGFTGYDQHGAYGLEAYYDSILSGTPGKNVSARDLRADGGVQSFEPKDGYSVMLTIDEMVQSSLEKNLEMANAEHSVKNRSTAIFMNIHTGEILGMATQSDFNPNEPYTLVDPAAVAELEKYEEGTDEYKGISQDLLYDQWRNKAISDPYEPGSVYKIITASMALEEEKTYFGDDFYCPGFIEVEDRTINCWWTPGHQHQKLHDIMRNSCNPGLITVGLRNGAEATSKYLDDFGFGKLTGIDLPGEAIGILHSRISTVNLASTSIGQSITVTPIQMITAASAAVNGGVLVKPYVVKQIMDAQGNVVETTTTSVKRQVISEETSEKIRDLVEEVVSNGTGRNAAVPGYRVGGKTGTSEKLDLKVRGIDEYVLSFIGFAPMDNPTYACLVVLDEPTLHNAYASVIAAPVVGAIFAETLPYLGVEAHFTDAELAEKNIKVPYLINNKPHDAQATLTALGLKTRIVGQGAQVIRQIPTSDTTLAKGGTVVLYTREEELKTNIVVPDLKGFTAEQVRTTLNDLSLNIKLEGAINTAGAVVVEQWPLPDGEVTTADVVKVTLAVIKEDGGVEQLSVQPSSTPDAQEDDWLADEEHIPDLSEGIIVITDPESEFFGDEEAATEEDPPPPPPPAPRVGTTGELLD